MLERPEHNPFLERFYAHGTGRDNPYALQTQLSFLFQRVEQMRELGQAGVFETGVVSDFLFAKDSLFAMLTLGDEDLALYRQIYRREQQRLPEPDLVIWLQAEPDLLLSRIRARGRPMEQVVRRVPGSARTISSASTRPTAGSSPATVARRCSRSTSRLSTPPSDPSTRSACSTRLPASRGPLPTSIPRTWAMARCQPRSGRGMTVGMTEM